MKAIEAIKIIKGLIASVELVYKTSPLTDKEPHPVTDALTLAISALEKQEQTIDKSCETCKHKDRLVSEWRCCECFRASNLEDYWEPYTEEEDAQI